MTKLTRQLIVEPFPFETRADLVAWAAANTPVNGRVYFADGLAYVGRTGASEIADLPGLIAFDAWTPGHMGAVSNPSSPINNTTLLQAGINAANTLNMVWRWEGVHALTDKLTIPPTLQMESDRAARLIAQGSVPTALELSAGNATGSHWMPIIQNFNGNAVIIRSNLARYHFPQALGCGTAFQFLADGTNTLDTIVEVEAISTCTEAVEFNATNAARVIQGCGLLYGFITNTMYPVVFAGTPCFWDGLFCRGEALDMTAARASGVVLHNTSGGSVPRFDFQARSWFGGAGFTTAPHAKIASGTWEPVWFTYAEATALNQNNMTANTLRSAQIKVNKASPATPRAISATAGIANYNGGVADSSTTLALRATTTASWPDGTNLSFFAYSVWADRNYDVWLATPRAMPTGVVLKEIADLDATEQGRIRISFTNLSGAAIASGAVMDVTLVRL